MTANQFGAGGAVADLAAKARAKRKKPPRQAGQVTDEGDHWFPRECPSYEDIRLAYHRRFIRSNGRPYVLPVYRDNWPQDRENRGWDATNCIGPRGKQWPRRAGKAYICSKSNYCSWCWERRRHRSGLLAAFHHIGDPVVIKHSVTLPGVRTDPLVVREAKNAWVRFLKAEGFQHVTGFPHTFGENPAEGPKGHLDFIASGTDCSIDSLIPDLNPKIADVLKPYHERPDQGFWTPHVSVRQIDHPTDKKQVNDLILAGMYAGRATLHVRRLLAGLYGPPYDPQVRMTTVTGKKGEQVERMHVGGKPVPDWNRETMKIACQTADEWDAAMGRPTRPRGVKVKANHLRTIIEDTPWRYKYRLATDDELWEKYLA